MLRTHSRADSSEMRSDSRRKRDAVLDAAMALFIEQGFGATSIDSVAARARVSKATVYAHFENKDALFAAVMKLACNTVVPPGKLVLPCPEMAASQFLGLLKTDVHMRLLLNQPANISRARLRRIVDCSVETFLNGTLPRKSEGRGTRRAR
jgi:hypothetical protein